MDAKELNAIKKMIKDTNGEIDFNNETIKLIEEFVKLKKKEMRDVYRNKKKKDNFVQDLKQFISNPNQKITYKEVAEWEKEGKFKYVKDKEEKKNSQFNKKTKQGQVEDDLDQTDQDLAESNE
jgi:hypothetical protein